MKVRLLKKLLNDTQYTLSNHGGYIAVGSAMVHNIISVAKETLELRYALDTFYKGRGAIDDARLLFIWDKLEELRETGKLREIIDGNDEIENPLPVFTVRNGHVIETATDAYGWPNVTTDGDIMYNNTHFKTEAEAIEYGLREYAAGVDLISRRVKEVTEQLAELQKQLQEERMHLGHFKLLQAIANHDK